MHGGMLHYHDAHSHIPHHSGQEDDQQQHGDRHYLLQRQGSRTHHEEEHLFLRAVEVGLVGASRYELARGLIGAEEFHHLDFCFVFRIWCKRPVFYFCFSRSLFRRLYFYFLSTFRRLNTHTHLPIL